METFFTDFLYRLVNWLYCTDLDDYLSGFDPADSSYYNFHDVGYPMLGWIPIVVSVLFVIIYYLVDKAGLNQVWHWLLWGMIGGLCSLCVSTYLCFEAVSSGDMLQYGLDVNFANCLMLGFGNLLLTFLFYFILSLIVNRFSTNCRRTPFKLF